MRSIVMIIAALMILAFFAGMSSALNPLKGDDWEIDADEDGLNNLREFLAGSDPNNWDTDGDGLPDGWEVDNSLDPADPSDAWKDNDYFGGEEYSYYSQVDPPYNNYAEYYRFIGIHSDTGEALYQHTDPNNPDTDGDGILDPDDPWPWDYPCGCPPPHHRHKEQDEGKEGEWEGDADGDGNADNDGDGITDLAEMAMGTDYNNPDTDGDSLIDSLELSRGLDPNDWDTDNDMLIDGLEIGAFVSTDGHLSDTDNDGIG